jgi:phosphatidylserine synthase
MLDIYLRKLKDQVLVPVATAFRDVHPNTVTLLSGFLGVLSAVAAAYGRFGTAVTFWLLNRFFDGLDGTVARMFNKVWSSLWFCVL